MKIKVGTAILSFLCCTMLAINSAIGAVWTITPSIIIAEIYTDDVDLDANFAQSDYVTQATVGGIVDVAGPRLDLNVNYGLTYLYYPGLVGDKDEFRHQLRADGTSELVQDHLFLDLKASVTQNFIDRRQSFTNVQVVRSSNRATVGIYDISPYFVRKVGGNFSTLTTRYRYSRVNAVANQNGLIVNNDFTSAASNFHEGSIILENGTKFSRLNWNFITNYRKQQSTSVRDNNIFDSTVGGGYSINRKIAAVGSFGFSSRNAAAGTGNFSGVVWDVGVILTPGPRTSLELRIGETFFGRTYIVNGSYIITPNMNFTISYSDRLDTFQALLLNNFQNGLDAGSFLQQTSLTTTNTRAKQWTARLEGTRGRSTIALVANSLITAGDLIDFDQSRKSLGVEWRRTMSSRVNVNASVFLIESDFTVDPRKDVFVSFSAEVDYRISESLVATLEYVHTNRKQLIFNFVPRASNFVRVSLGVTF